MIISKTCEVSCHYPLFLSAKVVEFNLSRNIMQTEYTAPTFCLCNLHSAANDPQTGNDPQIWTANDPEPQMIPPENEERHEVWSSGQGFNSEARE